MRCLRAAGYWLDALNRGNVAHNTITNAHYMQRINLIPVWVGILHARAVHHAVVLFGVRVPSQDAYTHTQPKQLSQRMRRPLAADYGPLRWEELVYVWPQEVCVLLCIVDSCMFPFCFGFFYFKWFICVFSPRASSSRVYTILMRESCVSCVCVCLLWRMRALLRVHGKQVLYTTILFIRNAREWVPSSCVSCVSRYVICGRNQRARAD